MSYRLVGRRRRRRRRRRRGVGRRVAPVWGSPAVWRRRQPVQPTVLLLLNCCLLRW